MAHLFGQRADGFEIEVFRRLVQQEDVGCPIISLARRDATVLAAERTLVA